MTERRRVRSGWFNNLVVNPAVSALGVTSALVVRGRRSGRERTLPVHVLEMDGARWLVAPRGETEWVLNVRAADGRARLRTGRSWEDVTLVEMALDDARRNPIVGAYRERWGKEVVDYWARLPDPKDHPVFEIT